MASTLRMASGRGKGGGERPPPSDGDGDASTSTDAVTVPLPSGRPRCPVCGERFSRGSRFCAFDGSRLAEGAAEEAPNDPLVGQVLAGKYTVERPIGEGGMGTVYEVRHNALDRRFALKVLRPEIAQNGDHMQRFLQEAKAAAAIGHPNIVSVSDFGEHEIRGRKVPFFVMEFLRGTSLAAMLKASSTLPPRRAARIIAACAEALDAAHAQGVIHRDLKPDNIFVSGDGDEVVKVLDFGVAKMQGAARLTKIGMVFGTPHYMSPEQARGQTVDHRADIYALGVILYECLSGHVPFEADTSMGVLTKQIFANPEPIERAMPEARSLGALGAIVMRCLAKEPDERYATMGDLAAALRQAVTDPAGAAAGALGGGSGVKRQGLRLREDTAIPPSEPSAEETAPRSWTRLVVFAAAGVAVMALLLVSVRALLFQGVAGSSAGAADGQAPPSSVVSSAAAAPGGSSALAASAGVTTAASAAPSASAPPVASSASDAPAVSGAPASAHASGAVAPAPSPSTPSSGAKKGVTGRPPVVDPWGPASGKKKPSSTAVVDPWAAPKK